MHTDANEERIDIGADVLDSSGEKAGTVSYVVVRPPKLHVTDIVVETGGFLGRDVVVPMDKVSQITEGKLQLSLDRDAIAKLEDYIEVQFQQAPVGWMPPSDFLYPAQSVLWAGGANYQQPSTVTVHAPAGTVGLSEGMSVESSDGHKLGSIESIDADETSENVTHLVIKEGFLFSRAVRVPADLVREVNNDHVSLSVTKDEAHALSDSESDERS